VPHRLQTNLESIASFWVAVLPPLGLLLFSARSLVRRLLRLRTGWLKIWGPTFLLILLASLAGHSQQASFALLLQALFYLVASSILHAERSTVRSGFLLALAVFGLSGLFATWQSRHYWREYDLFELVTRTVQRVVGNEKAEVIAGGESGTRIRRTWSIRGSPESLALELETRLHGGTPNQSWFESHPEFELKLLVEGARTFTRVLTPTNNDPYLLRRIDTGEPIANRTFRAIAELRAPEPVPAQGTRGLWLQEEGGNFPFEHSAVALDGQWRTYSVVWTAPASARSRIVRVVLNDFNGLTFDVGEVSLEVLSNGQWIPLGPLEPTGVALQLRWRGQELSQDARSRFIPVEQWQKQHLMVQEPSLATPTSVSAELFVERNISVNVADTVMRVVSGPATVRPAVTGQRQKFWFEQPNLAGHTIVAVGLALVSTCRTALPGLIGLLLTLAASFRPDPGPPFSLH
jgi:hypothetical protein